MYVPWLPCSSCCFWPSLSVVLNLFSFLSISVNNTLARLFGCCWLYTKLRHKHSIFCLLYIYHFYTNNVESHVTSMIMIKVCWSVGIGPRHCFSLRTLTLLIYTEIFSRRHDLTSNGRLMDRKCKCTLAINVRWHWHATAYSIHRGYGSNTNLVNTFCHSYSMTAVDWWSSRLMIPIHNSHMFQWLSSELLSTFYQETCQTIEKGPVQLLGDKPKQFLKRPWISLDVAFTMWPFHIVPRLVF